MIALPYLEDWNQSLLIFIVYVDLRDDLGILGKIGFFRDAVPRVLYTPHNSTRICVIHVLGDFHLPSEHILNTEKNKINWSK